MDLSVDRMALNRLLAVDGEQFQVPPYQRPYAWGPEQIDELWDDIVSTLGSGHFIGSIVLNTEDKHRPQVIDGQQRLTTLLMLLGLIRDQYHALNADIRNRPQRLMISDEFETGEAKWKFRNGDVNWPVFRDFVLRPPGDPVRHDWNDGSHLSRESRARNQPFFSNATRLAERLEEYTVGLEDKAKIDKLSRLETYISRELEFVTIRVGTVADAFLLFETLNDRGLQLSAGDLLKSHLLSRMAQVHNSREAVDDAADEWDGLLGDIGTRTDITRFLRHYLLMSRPSVRKDGVFDRFKEEVGETGPDILLKRLRTFGQLYGEFVEPERVSDLDVQRVLKDLATLRATQCYIALMPARRWLSSERFVEFARLAEVVTYRYSTIAQQDSKELERTYHRAAKLLEESGGTAYEEARQELKSVLPNSEQFVGAFMRAQMGTQYVLRYTMQRLEEYLLKPSAVEKEWKANDLVHIEHIMPQTLTEEWRDVLGDRVDEHRAYVNRWGNLTLLYSRINQSISNGSFDRKRFEYRRSEVELNQYFVDQEVWDLEAIEDRQRWLAELADQVWSVGVLEGASPTIPRIPGPVSVDGSLTDAERRLFESLCVETSSEDLLAQVRRVDGHEQLLLEAGDAELRDQATRIGNWLRELIDQSHRLDARGRALVRGAVEYFCELDDADPDGLDDDERVVRSVQAVVGVEPDDLSSTSGSS